MDEELRRAMERVRGGVGWGGVGSEGEGGEMRWGGGVRQHCPAHTNPSLLLPCLLLL